MLMLLICDLFLLFFLFDISFVFKKRLDDLLYFFFYCKYLCVDGMIEWIKVFIISVMILV